DLWTVGANVLRANNAKLMHGIKLGKDVCVALIRSVMVKSRRMSHNAPACSGKRSRLLLILLLGAIASAQPVSYNRRDIATGIAPAKVAIADFNGDGKADIAYV